ncbi:MAG: ClpXP protease specificity-enhancing factor SspB [Hyphomicrobiales bacterium]
MAEDIIRYDVLAQEAMRGVVKKVLTEVLRSGLPGEHHFYITFNTQAPGVRISSRLHERYPEEMTIVVQHQFWDLEVSSQSFEIGLAFAGVPEKLLVPFNAIKSFVDPSVQFGLQFDLVDDEMGEDNSSSDDKSATALGSVAPSAIAVVAKDVAESAEAEKVAETILSKTDAAGDNSLETDTEQSDDDKNASADVVSLDAFRKKAD